MFVMFPTSPVFLNVEELPPSDVFYSSQHKSILKMGRKKKNLDDTWALTTRISSQTSSLDIVWKGTSIAPYEELKELTQ